MNTFLKYLTLTLLGWFGMLAAAGLIRQARADLTLTSAKGRMEALRQVRQLDPMRADATARIGDRWMNAFPPRYDLAAAAYRDAAAADPFDAYHWLDYARASLRIGRKLQAERALAMAERVDMNNHEVLLDLGNIRLEMNDLERAAAHHARAIALNSEFADQLCPFYEASGWEPRQVAERLLSGSPRLLERYFRINLGSSNARTEAVTPLWEYVSAEKDAASPETWRAYYNFLIGKQEYDAAGALWGKIARKTYGKEWDAKQEPFWNGDFKQPFKFSGGLEWQIAKTLPAGCDVTLAPDGSEKGPQPGLRITFNGTTNVNAALAHHELLLEEGRTYRLRCQARAREMTTDNRPYLALTLRGERPTTLRSSMLNESGRQELVLEFTTPAGCRWAELAIRRDLCPRLNNRIKGEAWFGGFTLEGVAK